MAYFNNSGYDIFLYGMIIKSNMIFTVNDLADITFKINNNIKLPELFKILNMSFALIEPKVEDKKHLDIILIPAKYNNMKIFNIKGTGNIYMDNVLIQDGIIRDNLISGNMIVAIENKLTYEIGIC